MSFAWIERIRQPLALRLALWYAAIFVASVGLLSAVTYGLLAASLQRRDREAVDATLGDCVSAYRAGGLEGLRNSLNTADELGVHPDLLVRVLTSGNDVLFLSPPKPLAGFRLEELPQSLGKGAANWVLLREHGGDAVLEVAGAALPDGTVVQVGRSTASRQELLRRFRTVLTAVFALTVAVGLLGGAVLTHWSLRPLHDLAQTVRGIIDTGELRARVEVRSTSDPLDALGALLNRMLDRIESLVGAMGESLDSVAHELRTPLARLRASAEQALTARPDANGAREALSDCLEESESVLGLLDTLMDVAEARAGTLSLQREQLKVTELLERTIELYADIAENKGVVLQSHAPDGLVLVADRQRLAQAIANLVDNAIKYTHAGGRVEVVASRGQAETTLVVSDDGVGILEADLPRIFDRLFRGGGSRGQRGLGLGLSLAQAIAIAHGGRITVESEVGRGSRFTIHLPDPAAFLSPM